ncbi:PAS domain-containing protein [Tautonia sp. JC769]|uniref:PAS domain-containing protein n=1 Tax=Tautonia sp. JC769 TaxID=3232135 RepID=UPI00345A0185
MFRQPRPRILDYLVAMAAIGLSAGVRFLLDPALGPRQPYVTFYPAILFSALFLGPLPAILAVAVSLMIGAFLFVLPELNPMVPGAADVSAIVAFLMTSLIIIWLCESYRRAQRLNELEARDRLKAEAAERRQRERLEAILASLGEGVIVAGEDGLVIKLNPIAEQLTGWPADEAVGRPLDTVFHTRDPMTTKTAELPVAEILRGGIVHRTGAPALLRRRDGSELPIESSSAAIQHDGQGGLVVVLRDVSERLRIEQAERADRERLRLAMEAGRLGTWDWDVRSGRVNWAENHLVSYGIPAGHFQGTFDSFRSLVHPDDLPRLDRRLREALDHGDSYEAEFRLQNPNGSLIWISDRGVVIRDDDNAPTRVIGVSADITDRKRDEDALRASERHFRLLADAVPQIVWTSAPDGNLLSLNRRWHDYVGIAPDDPDVLRRWRESIHPDDLPDIFRRWQHSYQTGDVFEGEYRIRDRHGNYRWHLGRCVPVRDADGEIERWIGSGTDIDDRKRAERTLHLLADAGILLANPTDPEEILEQFPRLVIPGLADACVVYLIEPDGSIRRATIAHRDPAVRRRMAEILSASPIDPDGSSPIAEVLRTGRPDLRAEIDAETLATLIPDPDRRARFQPAWPTSHMIVPLKVAGKTIGAFGLSITTPDRRFSTDDLPVVEDLARRAAIALENARLYLELRETDRRKTEFLAVLAHELRNPLAPIRTALELLRQPEADRRIDPEAAERETVRAMAGNQVAHMARLIEDLMDVTRISRGTIELRREAIDLVPIARRVVSAVGTQVAEIGQALSVDLPTEPVWIRADPARIEQILWNILTNASKYSDSGGRIALTIAPRDDQAVIRVRDTGIGIDPEALARIFELFVQAEQGPGRRRGGLGIGLSLVRMLVELHGGSITAQSRGLGQGSEFEIRLPTIPPPEAPVPSPASRSRGANHQQARPTPLRLLIVDDNRDAAVTLGTLLGKIAGHDVRLAHDGPEALRVAARFEPEVVLLDIGLPGMDGYEVARRLRDTPAGSLALLIALTGWGQQEDHRRSQEAGFDHHLVKPVDSDVIEGLIASSRPATRPGPNP